MGQLRSRQCALSPRLAPRDFQRVQGHPTARLSGAKTSRVGGGGLRGAIALLTTTRSQRSLRSAVSGLALRGMVNSLLNLSQAPSSFCCCCANSSSNPSSPKCSTFVASNVPCDDGQPHTIPVTCAIAGVQLPPLCLTRSASRSWCPTCSGIGDGKRRYARRAGQARHAPLVSAPLEADLPA